MDKIKNVYIIGLGAIGGAFAGKIQDTCPGCLKVIVNDDRYRNYIKNGVTINGRKYGFDYITPDTGTEEADLILIAVKQHNIPQTIKDIRNFTGAKTIIMSLLNGISSEEIIARVFGMKKMLYSFCVGTDTVREGTAVSYKSLGRIVFGEKTNRTISPRVRAVGDFFEAAGIPYSIPEDMIREQWWKFMMNVGINQASAVLRAPYGVFQQEGAARDLMIAASREVILLSGRAGVNLCEEDIGKYMTILAGLAPGGKTSMLQDMEAARKTEVEIFSGTVSELGRRYGVNTPVNDTLFMLIRAMEQMALKCQ